MNFKHFMILQVLDCITTIIALTYLGLNELNPLYSSAFAKIGLIPGLIAIKLIVLLVMYWIIMQISPEIKIKQFYNMDGRKIGINIICFMFIIVVLNNTLWIVKSM